MTTSCCSPRRMMPVCSCTRLFSAKAHPADTRITIPIIPRAHKVRASVQKGRLSRTTTSWGGAKKEPEGPRDLVLIRFEQADSGQLQPAAILKISRHLPGLQIEYLGLENRVTRLQN